MCSDSHTIHENILGMQLCSEGIFSQRQIFSLNSQESLSISFEDKDVHLTFSPEVLNYPNLSIEAAFAPLGPVGPHFVFPDGTIPVSPAVWLCSSLQKEFPNMATLKLSHCFECKNTEDSKLLCFLKAEHEDITRDKSCLLYTSPSPRDATLSRMPSSA